MVSQRLLEDGNQRLLEDGSVRLLEGDGVPPPAAVGTCITSLELCALRVNVLTSAGRPTPLSVNGYATDAAIKLQVAVTVAAGVDLEQQNGAAAVCAAFKEPDRIKRLDLSMDLCQFDAQLVALLTSGGVISSAGNAIGYQFPSVTGSDPLPVCVEVWSKAWKGLQQASPPITAPAAAYLHWVFPYVQWTIGGFAVEGALQVLTLNGAGTENVNITVDGPWGDWPDFVSAAGGMTQAGGWFLDDQLPPTPCDYPLTNWHFISDASPPIPGDGSGGDQTAAINAWMAGLPSGTPDNVQTYAFSDPTLAPMLFRTDGTLLATGKQYVNFEGCGSTFQRITHSATRDFPHWKFVHCEHYEYNDLSVVGEAPAASGYIASVEAQHAFAHLSCYHGASLNCYADAVWGDGMNFAIAGFAPGDGWCDSHTVENFSTGRTHRDPIVITSGSNLSFLNCDFGTTPRTGCDMEPNSSAGGATDILFDGCTWGVHTFNTFSATASGLGEVSRITIRNCQSIGAAFQIQAGDSVIPGLRADWTVSNNFSDTQAGNPNGAVMAFFFCSGNIVVTGNTNPLQTGRTPAMRMARFDASTTTNATITYSGNTPDTG